MIFCIEYVSVLTFGILLLLPSIMHVLTSLLRLHQWIRSSIVKLTNKEDFVFICLLQLANVSLSLALYAMYIHINYFSQTLVNHFRSSHWMELALVFRSILEHGMVSLTLGGNVQTNICCTFSMSFHMKRGIVDLQPPLCILDYQHMIA